MISKVQQESMTGSVIAQVQTIMLKQLEENRHYVRTVAEVVELCDQIVKILHEFGVDIQCVTLQKLLENQEKEAEKVPESLCELYHIISVNAGSLSILKFHSG